VVSTSEDESLDPRRSSYGREYWFRRCEGILVETATRRIGRVDGIRYGVSQDIPEALAVRTGRFPRRELLISVTEVERVSPEQRRIVVSDRPSPEMSSRPHSQF
jgi:hypothetical protein